MLAWQPSSLPTYTTTTTYSHLEHYYYAAFATAYSFCCLTCICNILLYETYGLEEGEEQGDRGQGTLAGGGAGLASACSLGLIPLLLSPTSLFSSFSSLTLLFLYRNIHIIPYYPISSMSWWGSSLLYRLPNSVYSGRIFDIFVHCVVQDSTLFVQLLFAVCLFGFCAFPNFLFGTLLQAWVTNMCLPPPTMSHTPKHVCVAFAPLDRRLFTASHLYIFTFQIVLCSISLWRCVLIL